MTALIAALFAVTTTVSAQTLENLWEVNADDNLANDNLARGLTYNSLSKQVVLGPRTGGNKAVLYNGDTGAIEGYMNMTGISGGGIWPMAST